MLKPNFWQDGVWWCYRASFGDEVIAEGKSMSWKSAVVGCYKSASAYMAKHELLTQSAIEELNNHIAFLERSISDE